MQKEIHFVVDKILWEKFHKIFPGRGEKTTFFRRVMQLAVLKQGERDAFIEGIWREAQELYGSGEAEEWEEGS